MKLRVGTHDGPFHADDVLALATLHELDMVGEVVRTRDSDLLAVCDMRVDVGDVYDHATQDYDHHQRGGAGKRPNGIPYAAFGLIWRHWGEELVGSAAVAAAVDRAFVQPLDAEDVGLKSYKLMEPALVLHSVGTAIGRFNPEWNDPQGDYDAAFAQAVVFGREILRREITHAQAVAEATEQVRAAIERAADPRLIVLDGGYPWKEVVLAEAPEALFVVYPTEEPDDWRVRVIPRDAGSFETRRDLPAAWGGKRAAELVRITGVEDATFCHPALFLAGAGSMAGALKLAELALG